MTVHTPDMRSQLTDRWYPLIANRAGVGLSTCHARFRIGCAGRRSGKTERAKRNIVIEALNCKYPSGRYVCAAPTQEQAKQIYWDDLQLLVPDWGLIGSRRSSILSSSPQTIKLYNGASILVMGMDRPARIEGPPLDGIVCDEYADMKPETWGQSVRPALSTRGRPGWAWFIGKPRGRNHYWRLVQKALADDTGAWAYWHWKSADILDPAEITAAQADVDELTWKQEYEADFVNFEGRVYYDFDRTTHCDTLMPHYDPEGDLIICHDFNRAPGVAVICQEMEYQGRTRGVDDDITAVIGEVWIPRNSTTVRVCRRVLQDWGKHRGNVMVYGDATGGRRYSASWDDSSDWDQVQALYRGAWGSRCRMRVDTRGRNPDPRSRVISMNTRIRTVSGRIRLMVDHRAAPHVVDDLEGVCWIEGTGAGEIDKESDEDLTHVSDALGYYITRRHPVRGASAVTESL